MITIFYLVIKRVKRDLNDPVREFISTRHIKKLNIFITTYYWSYTWKEGIITPTFEPHFKFVLKYLDSAEKYITDPENITFFFTVSEGDVEKLSKLLVNYKN